MTRGPHASRTLWLVGALLALPFAAGLDLVVYERSVRHAGLLALLAASTGVATYLATARLDVTTVAAWTVAAWSLPHEVSGTLLLAAFAPAAIVIVPHRLLAPAPRTIGSLIAAAAAGAGSLHLVGSTGPALAAAVLAAALSFSRPEAPTQGTIRVMWWTSVFLPAIVLLGALLINAPTGWLEQADVRAVLAFGLGAWLLALLASVALLGLSTLIESTHRAQGPAWLAAATALAIALSTLPARDTTLTLSAVAAAVVPIGVLASLATARLRAAIDHPLAPLSLALAPVIAGLQAGLL